MTKKNNLYVWVSDYSENTGEGRLARLYIKKIKDKNEYKRIILNQKKILKSKYFSSIIGILYCWKKFINNQNICYLNYLPFWNFFLFIFLPPQTLLGPITGGARFSKKNIINYFIRGIIFKFFYKISEIFLYFRQVEIIFSTNLLKKNLSKYILKRSKFNFIFYNFELKKKYKKKIDFLIYFRKHKNKKHFFSIKLIKKLIRKNFKIHIVGDFLDLPKVVNHKFLSNSKIMKLQAISKYTLASGENLYSFFTIEAISNHMKILVNINEKIKINFFKRSFIKLNYEKEKNFKFLKKCK